MTEVEAEVQILHKPDELVRTDSTGSLSSSSLSEAELPEVGFAPILANGVATIDSPRSNSECQPLLGRMEPDAQFNHFPGDLMQHFKEKIAELSM